MNQRVAIIGGGAAGFFAAINAARMNSELEIQIFEKSQQLLGKVKVSGGGRCNVTHACFEPKELIKFYPRGSKELLGPFHTFQPGDIFDWFEQRSIALKTEADNRVFPITDSSQTIIDCFMEEAKKYHIAIKTGLALQQMHRTDNQWNLTFSDGIERSFDHVVIASGSSKSMWELLQKQGHSIVPPVPSLFTFNIKDKTLNELQGVVAPSGTVKIEGTKFMASGPILLTHWGLSGPGILKLSAWAARDLALVNYDFIIRINWDNRYDKDSSLELLKDWRTEHSKTQVKAYSPVKIPHRLWVTLIERETKLAELKWAEVSNKQLESLAELLTSTFLRVQGKSTFKEEFVTAGGVELKEIDFKTMQSKILPNIYFCGEVLNIDAVTGGFNFQAAWTTAYLIATALSKPARK